LKNAKGIILSEDEIIIREYEASSLDSLKAKGFVIATNRRLIFTGSTQTSLGNSVIVRDTKIDSISGVTGGLTRKKGIVQTIIGLIIALAGFMLLFNDSPFYGLGFIAIGGFIAYRGFNGGGVQMYLAIMSSDSKPSINVDVAASGFFSRVKSHDAFLTVDASGPGAHTEQMIREIGALVQDIQTMGDLAIAKWQNKPLEAAPVHSVSTSEQFAETIQTIKEKTASKTTVINELKNRSGLNNDNDEVVATAAVKTEVVHSSKKCGCGNNLNEEALFCNACGEPVEPVKENIFG